MDFKTNIEILEDFAPISGAILLLVAVAVGFIHG